MSDTPNAPVTWSSTANVCRRCGRVDYPHVCFTIPELGGRPVAVEVQGCILFDVTHLLSPVREEKP